jgi:transposase-like protein
MNIHKNARLTPQGRCLLVRRVEELGWQMAEAANAAGISQRQGYRWLARFRSGGTAALGDRSSAPGCCKHRIGAERISELTALRGQRMSGPAIARQLGMPVSTVGGKAARKGPRIPLPRQRVSLRGPEASIFDLPNIACGMLFSVNMWADEFSAPNLVKAVPALQMHSQ